jgi:hypothetical protein
MVTIFTIPKAFSGHVGLIQRNAIQSWIALGHGVEIVLVGNDPGVAEAARDFGVVHIESVERNEFGTPLLQSAFDQVLVMAKHDTLCFVNADIILLNEFLAAVGQVTLKRYLMVGDRIDLDLSWPLDFSGGDWANDLRSLVAKSGKEHGTLGSDYFVFRKDPQLTQLNGLAVGRPNWDNWFIYRARVMGIPVINASESFKVIHQNHGYGHVPRSGGRTSDGKDWRGPEVERQRLLIGKIESSFTPADATYVLTRAGLRPAWSYDYLSLRWARWPKLNPRVAGIVAVADGLVPKMLKRTLRSVFSKRSSASQ